MARMYPNQIDPTTKSDAERVLYAAFREQLDDSHTIFHIPCRGGGFSCPYIGKHGGCHHCHALALAFLQQPEQFVELRSRPLEQVAALADLPEYLRGVTLDE